jgi:hypothetical protein
MTQGTPLAARLPADRTRIADGYHPDDMPGTVRGMAEILLASFAARIVSRQSNDHADRSQNGPDERRHAGSRGDSSGIQAGAGRFNPAGET